MFHFRLFPIIRSRTVPQKRPLRDLVHKVCSHCRYEIADIGNGSVRHMSAGKNCPTYNNKENASDTVQKTTTCLLPRKNTQNDFLSLLSSIKCYSNYRVSQCSRISLRTRKIDRQSNCISAFSFLLFPWKFTSSLSPQLSRSSGVLRPQAVYRSAAVWN